jgi:hypothetical protein
VNNEDVVLDAATILEALNRHAVDYVVIGAWAVEAQGIRRSSPTRDIDITPSTGAENLRRLSAALRDVGARIRTADVPDGLIFDHDGASLARSAVWNLVCPAGEFDISFTPSGFPDGYDDLAQRSVILELAGGVRVHVAAVKDVVASKRSAGRDKDVRALPEIIDQARKLGLLD